MVRIGLVGYGSGGRYFHTPYLQAAHGVELVGVVARSEARRSEVAADLPGVPVFDSLTSLLAAGPDAVVITTPPETRRELVLEAIAAGVHVVADKPFAPSAAGAQELADAAEAHGVLLSVFHNRRFDTDLQTVAAAIATGELGDLWRVHSRFDLDEPGSLEAGPTGGLLRDLGTHLVDQLLWLLGPAEAVSASLDEVDLPEGRTDAGFTISLRHASGVRSFTEASKINHVSAKTWRVYGSRGSYTASGTDVQAQAVFAGLRPADDPDGWGYEAEEHWGTLATDTGSRRFPSAQGSYTRFYEEFAAAVRGGGPAPSPATDGVTALAVLDAARASAESGGAWQAV